MDSYALHANIAIWATYNIKPIYHFQALAIEGSAEPSLGIVERYEVPNSEEVATSEPITMLSLAMLPLHV